MEHRLVGHRLRQAREAVGLSQKAVANKIGVPRTAITQIEQGNRKISTLELSMLANLYRRGVTALLDETTTSKNEDVLVVLHRLAPSLQSDPEVNNQVEKCVDLCKVGVELKRLIGEKTRPGHPVYEVTIPRSFGEAVVQADKAADQERRRLGIGNAPISDIAELISNQGIWISSVELPNEMSGLFIHHHEIGDAIVVNSTHPKARKRFSYAHEYAHALLDRDRDITISSTENSSELVECRANAFAASFLMPRDGVSETLQTLNKGLPSRQSQIVFDVASGKSIDQEIRTPSGSQRINYKDIATLAHHFGVSYQAALYRLKSLHYINSSETKYLLPRERFGRMYLKELEMFNDLERREKPKHWNRELRREVTNLTIEAYRREEISGGRLREIATVLEIPGNTLDSLANAAVEG
ncbi:MAG: XRE family transcriptional regulator [Gammaproteobacteria bacterium]|nr:XRE family transcriptional regulator [Gammaproteobacteria bacterium]